MCVCLADGPLPEGWKEIVDKEKQAVYYWNALTAETTWIRPRRDLLPPATSSSKAEAGDEGADEDEEARRAALEVVTWRLCVWRGDDDEELIDWCGMMLPCRPRTCSVAWRTS